MNIDTEPTNADRAKRIAEVLPRYHFAVDRPGNIPLVAIPEAMQCEQETIQDLIADALHFAASMGWDAATIAANALRTYAEKEAGERPTPEAKPERMLRVFYVCPKCGEEWEEEYSCACDSECGACGCENIEAARWEDLESGEEGE